MTLVSDVCSKESLEQAMSKIILHYGGLDIFIPNAGVAAVGEIADLEESTWRRLVEINQTGAFLSTQIAAKTLQKQGIGGSIILISSKNVPAPGAAFAAYSSSKAGAHQLARVAALELASHNIRVNMICPDAIFHHGERSSGLWETVGPDRAKAKGFSEEELESHYQNRNLLQTQVTATDVGRAVVFFATQQTPTTGAWLPVDGGLPEAFPR